MLINSTTQGQGFVPEPPSADYDTIQSQQIEQDIAYLRKKEKSNTDKVDMIQFISVIDFGLQFSKKLFLFKYLCRTSYAMI